MTAPLKIFGITKSRTRRTLWMAEEAGLAYELVEVDPHPPPDGPIDPGYAAINPNLQVPAIEDEGFCLWESLAINLYLAKKHCSALYPETLQGEALAWQWSFWAMTALDKPIIIWALHDHALPEGERDAETLRVAKNELERPLGVLESALTETGYLIGGRFSVADLNVAAVLYRAQVMDLAEKPAVSGWLERCWQRPAAGRVKKMRGDI